MQFVRDLLRTRLGGRGCRPLLSPQPHSYRAGAVSIAKVRERLVMLLTPGTIFAAGALEV